MGGDKKLKENYVTDLWSILLFGARPSSSKLHPINPEAVKRLVQNEKMNIFQ
jgi:hypothetical protein